MKMIKIEAGHYESEDGRVVIQRRTNNRYWWLLTIDGQAIPLWFTCMKDARKCLERMKL